MMYLVICGFVPYTTVLVSHRMKSEVILFSEFHFLPPSYAFVTLITPSSVKSFRLPILETLEHLF